MPTKPAHYCARPGCPNLSRAGSFCEEHTREKARVADQERGSASARGYDVRWRRIRAMFLSRHPICIDPDHRHEGRVVVATDVDHIVSKSRGGSDQWSNLQPLCHSCHSAKTAREDGGYGRA